MKLRLRHNMVRLRLTQSEVAQLRDVGSVEEHVDFGPGSRLTYRIDSSSDQVLPSAEFRNGNILLSVPRAMVNEWADSTQIGMESDGAIRVLIEKDFKCLDPADPEENLDTFPNPLEGKIC